MEKSSRDALQRRADMNSLYPFKDFAKEYDITDCEGFELGSFGQILKTTHIPTKKVVALKKFLVPLNRANEKDTQTITEREI